MDKFCRSLLRFSRASTREVRIGRTVIGGGAPVAVQSMTNTDTLDTAACVAQIGHIHAAGCDIVRLTAPGMREARNLAEIAGQVRLQGLERMALVADIHFTPDVALVAAQSVDKVRINPGNYDIAKLPELLDVCRRRAIPIRIGVNHGSLASHMVERYGDTPAGMVESAMEFLRECRSRGFDEMVVSMKSSNVRVMVHAYRLLAVAMAAEEMNYPLHLGITEAGDGPDGRIRSAVGIGALMADGLGDTIRVSLTEAPENEIPVARAIVEYFEGRENDKKMIGCAGNLSAKDNTTIDADLSFDVDASYAGIAGNAGDDDIEGQSLYSPFQYNRRPTEAEGNIGGANVPVLYGELDEEARRAFADGRIVVLDASTGNAPAQWRAAVLGMMAAGDRRPVILHRKYDETSMDRLRIKAACDFGMPFIDGLADGIWIENETTGDITRDTIDATSLSILQAARVRMTKTEYIACPGCGRTLFDLQSTLAAVRERTSHLNHLKIAVMGCIVNGPGEMADADYGYVGQGRGMVTLYKGKEVVRRNIPQDQAVQALVELIESCGDWKDPA